MISNRSGKLLLFQNFLAVLTFTFTLGALAPKKQHITLHKAKYYKMQSPKHRIQQKTNNKRAQNTKQRKNKTQHN